MGLLTAYSNSMVGTNIISRLNNNILISYNNVSTKGVQSGASHKYTIVDSGRGYRSILMDVDKDGVYNTHGLVFAPKITKPTHKFLEGKTIVTSDIITSEVTLYFKAGYTPEVDYVLRILGETTTGDVSCLAVILINYDLLLRYQKIIPNPLTYGSQVFDRIVTFQVPSLSSMQYAQGFELNGYLLFKQQSALIADISPIVDVYNDSYDFGVSYDVEEVPQFRITIPSASQADRFNVFLSLDKKSGHINYYPYWGSDIYTPIDTSVMNAIESRGIDLYFGEKSIANEGWADFNSQYGGADERRWVTMHEMKVTKYYPSPTTPPEETSFSFTENYSKRDKDGKSSYRYSFRPTIFDDEIIRIPENDVSSVMVVYTCRLVNRQDLTQVVRTASLSISGSELDRYRHTANRPLNLHVDKVTLKYESENPSGLHAPVLDDTSKKESVIYEKVFYNSQDIQVNVHGEGIYTTQEGSLFKLHKSPSLYVFRLYDNKRKDRLDLSSVNGLIYLRVYDDNNQPIDIEPTYSANMSPVLGELEFYINEQLVDMLKLSTKRSAEDKTYSIISKTRTMTTTIVEGIYD